MSLLYITYNYKERSNDKHLELFHGYKNLKRHQKFMALLFSDDNIRNVLLY